MKRLFILLIFILSFAITSCTKTTNEYAGFKFNKIKYYISDELIFSGYMIADYIGSEKDLVIPDYINDIPVVAIGEAFSDFVDLNSIVIPNTVKYIGSNAFKNCSMLKTLVIPDSVIQIANNAFQGCDSLKSITIPFVGSERYPDSPFYGKLGAIFGNYIDNDNDNDNVPYSLEEVIVTGSVTNICDEAFQGCKQIKRIIIHDGVTTIGKSAFKGCSGLTNLIIPNSVTSIHSYALSGCDSLFYTEYNNGIYFGNETNPYLALVAVKNTSINSFDFNENVKSILNDVFCKCRNLKDITIPNGVTTIGASAFADSGLTSIQIPDSVTSIGESTFELCTGLEYVKLSKEIKKIERGLFNNCFELTNILIPKGVTSIDNFAFMACRNLASITIPSSVISIGAYAFHSCHNLREVHYLGTMEQWNAIKIDVYNYELLSSSKIYYE